MSEIKTSHGTLSPRMLLILRFLNGQELPVTASEIAAGIGMDKLPDIHGGGRHGHGKGRDHRVFNPAQRIISSLTSLKNKGLIYPQMTVNFYSGYVITTAGDEALKELDS